MPMLGLKSESIGGSKEPVLKNFLPNAGLVFGFLCFSLSAGADSNEDKPVSVTVHVLGVAQDAGNPQINCYKPRCLRVWETPALSSAGSSLAVVVDAPSFHFPPLGIRGSFFVVLSICGRDHSRKDGKGGRKS